MRSVLPASRSLLPGVLGLALISVAGSGRLPIDAASALQSPEQFFGFRIGSDNKLARWDRITEYFRQVASVSDRVRYRELGKTSDGNPFVLLEISAPGTLENLDRYKQLERRLYFQGGAPSDVQRDEIFREGKVVLLITCSIHATEVGATQMAIELVHRLATEDSPEVKKILDNVIFLLVPSLNPDGQIMVTDWSNKNLGTPYENSPLPWLYHPYVGHDNNRDMYMFTQRESQYTAKVLWQEWFPSVWLDEHQQGSNGARIFVMPATDPINPNVHPLIYRWNGIFGQSQAAALEAAGKEGVIYNSTYTNFWQGAMAWSGWWHNQVGLLTEVASARLAAPTEQRKADPAEPPPASATGGETRGQRQRRFDSSNEVLPPPRDVTSRTEYPRPWLGGRWTLRDIVDYELIVTMALLDTAADRREALLRQIYAVNAATLAEGSKADPSAFLVPVDTQHDPNQAAHLVEKLQMAGVEVWRAQQPFECDGRSYAAGTFVVPMTQVFARYAKDMLEKQTYPEVKRAPNLPPEPPYDVTAWSLGMLLGVDVVAAKSPVPSAARLEKLSGAPTIRGSVSGNGARVAFDYRGPDAAAAINALLAAGGRVTLHNEGPATRVSVSGAGRKPLDDLAARYGLHARATNGADPAGAGALRVRAPRIGMYQPWTGGNMDEGWTRWVLEQYGFKSTPLHNAEVRAGGLRQRFDAIVLPDQQPRDIVSGFDGAIIRPEYRGGIGDAGIAALQAFVAEGGTLVALGAASDFVIERFPLPVRNVKRGLTRDQHFAPGTILRVQVDRTHPLGFGMDSETYGFYNNSPFFELVEGFSSQKPTIVARYPNSDVVASGWLKGEELMTGRAAVVSIDMEPGRIVLFGLRPQHRAQTHATFLLLFNSLYLAAAEAPPGS